TVVKKLYRSTRDKKLFGLCGGLAESLGVDATLLRILAIVLAVFTSGGFILVYILAAFVVPKEPPMYGGPGPYGRGPAGPDGYWGYPPGGGYYNPPQGGSWRSNGPGPAPGPAPHSGSYPGSAPGTPHQAPPAPGNIDAMMDDLEKKALRREIEDLRNKIKQMEKGE